MSASNPSGVHTSFSAGDGSYLRLAFVGNKKPSGVHTSVSAGDGSYMRLTFVGRKPQ